MYFLDAHSIPSIGSGSAATSSAEVLSFEAASRKAGHGSDIEALVVASLKVDLPSFFGSYDKTQAVDKDTRVSPSVKSGED